MLVTTSKNGGPSLLSCLVPQVKVLRLSTLGSGFTMSSAYDKCKIKENWQGTPVD
jgi:hypothetical protein